MVGYKSTQTRMVGIIDKIYSYTVFSGNRVSTKRDASLSIIPTILVCILFLSYHPYLVLQFFSCFLYLLV